MTQSADPCLTSLSALTPADVTVAFDSVTTSGSVGQWDTFFANSDAANCPVTSCTLYGFDCSTAYATAYTGPEMSVAASTPFVITAMNDNAAGWTEAVCVSCTNGAQAITYSTFTVIQSPLNCASALSAAASPLAD